MRPLETTCQIELKMRRDLPVLHPVHRPDLPRSGVIKPKIDFKGRIYPCPTRR